MNVYDVVANDKYLYSCSNDETVKIWNIGTGEFVKAIERSVDAEVVKIFCTNGKLYTGDILGNVSSTQNSLFVSFPNGFNCSGRLIFERGKSNWLGAVNVLL